jgi:hypothetical protein
MPEAAAIPLPAPERRRRRGGQAPFVPTKEQRDAVAIMAALGASQPTMIALLCRNGGMCKDLKTLRKAFREELKQGREHLVTALGSKMVSWATGDGPHAFSACAFLLRTLGGWQWRLPKGDDSDLPDGRTSELPGKIVILPDNRRGDAKPEMFGKPPSIEARPEQPADETKPNAEQSTDPKADDWTWRKVT